MMQRAFPFTASLSDRPLDTTASAATPTFTPGLAGFTYADLRDARALPRLTAAFDAFAAPALGDAAWADFARYRETKGEGMSPEAVSNVIVHTAPVVAAFLARLFGIEDGRATLRADALPAHRPV